MRAAGCERIFAEKMTGTAAERPVLTECLSVLREGDTLVVYKLDRLGRTLKIIVDILERLRLSRIDFVSLSDNINTEGPSGKLMFSIIAAFAQYERDILVERTQEGRRMAREKGTRFGRPKGSRNRASEGKAEACAALYRAGTSISGIRRVLGIGSIETVYRYLRDNRIVPDRKKDKDNEGSGTDM